MRIVLTFERLLHDVPTLTFGELLKVHFFGAACGGRW